MFYHLRVIGSQRIYNVLIKQSINNLKGYGRVSFHKKRGKNSWTFSDLMHVKIN